MFSSYSQLMAMLEDGWRIEPPVYERPRWRSGMHLKRENAYHFALWNDEKVNLVSVLACPEIERFLADNKLAVDRL